MTTPHPPPEATGKEEAAASSALQKLDRLADALADDILNASDEEILAEFAETHGDPDLHAAEMRARFEDIS